MLILTGLCAGPARLQALVVFLRPGLTPPGPQNIHKQQHHPSNGHLPAGRAPALEEPLTLRSGRRSRARVLVPCRRRSARNQVPEASVVIGWFCQSKFLCFGHSGYRRNRKSDKLEFGFSRVCFCLSNTQRDHISNEISSRYLASAPQRLSTQRNLEGRFTD